MATYVFVSTNLSTDAWNKLTGKQDYPPGGFLGDKVWKNILPIFKQHNHTVFTITLNDPVSFSLTDHITQVTDFISQHNLTDIILVGGSYCGMVITGVAGSIEERIRLLVYIDAVLPDSGQSLLDIFSIAQFSIFNPKQKLPKAYKEKLQFDETLLQSMKKFYILCADSSFASVTALAKKKIEFDNTNWTYKEIKASHVPMVTDPDLLIPILLEIAK